MTLTLEPQPFRLLDLPEELQVCVCEKYFDGAGITVVGYVESSGRLLFTGMPSLDIELTNRKIHIEARRARDKRTSSTLTIIETSFFQECIAHFISDEQYIWVRNHVQALSALNAQPPSNSINWNSFFQSLPLLKQVFLGTIPSTSTLPCSLEMKRGFEDMPNVSIEVIVKVALQMVMQRVQGGNPGEGILIPMFDGGTLKHALAAHNTNATFCIISATKFKDLSGQVLFSCDVKRTYQSGSVRVLRQVPTSNKFVESVVQEMMEGDGQDKET